MHYTIAIFSEIEKNNQIQEIRKKYDPSYNFIKPHIGLVYYFDKNLLTNKSILF